MVRRGKQVQVMTGISFCRQKKTGTKNGEHCSVAAYDSWATAEILYLAATAKNPVSPRSDVENAVANSWFLRKQDAVLNKILQKIKIDGLKFKLEIVEALRASPPTNKSILTDDKDNSVVILLAKRMKRYNPPAIHVTAFILTIPGQKARHV
ncbi:uncharacterized protein TNCV_2371881 [Trichonephila clavipes]|nr:uncharacterized protein TNCV_2371881 [Trichonephila clavipes]